MANGFCPYLLQHIASIAGTAKPQYKVEAHGFLEMLVKAGITSVSVNPDVINRTRELIAKVERQLVNK